MRIYVNGNLDKKETKGYTDQNTGSVLYLGRTPEGMEYFDGLMDDLRIYNRTLTNSEVQAVYNFGQ